MKKILVLTILLLLLAACGPTQTIVVTATQTTLQPGGPTVAPAPNQPSQPVTAATNPAPGHGQQSNAAVGIPNFDHIILIVLENTSYSVAMDGSSMPHFASLAQKYVLLSNYFGVSHPSLPNYLALMSGSTQGVTSDCTSCFVNAQNLAGELDNVGKTWKAYMESMPSPCFMGNADPYAQKHDPLLYFDSIRTNTSLCDSGIVPMSQLDTDLSANKLPNFSFIMPNLCNSGHDCSPSTADTWLNDTVSKLQSSPALGDNSLIVVTFDEAPASDKSSCCGKGKGGGHVATVLISPKAKSPFQDATPYSHYSLLKTILVAWNLPQLGKTNEASVQPIIAPWSSK